MWKPADWLDHNPRSYELEALLNLSRTVALTFWKIHCCVSDSGSHLFMKIRLSPGLQSMQPLLTRWYKDLSWSKKKMGRRKREKEGEIKINKQKTVTVTAAEV